MRKIATVCHAKKITACLGWSIFGVMLLLGLPAASGAQVAPTVTINSLSSPISNNTATLSGTMSSGATITVSVNTTASVGPVSSPTVTTWRCTVTGLTTGENITTVTAMDGQGGAASAKIALDASVVGQWHMDNNWLDSSGRGLNGTAYSGATFTTNARVGSHAGSFNGGSYGGYVTIPYNSALDPQQITVEAWIKVKSFTPLYWDMIVSKGTNAAVNGYYGLTVYDTHYACAVLNIGGTTFYAVGFGRLLSPDTWYHLAMTYDNTTLKLYVNGAIVGSQAINLSRTSNTNQIYFGNRGDSYTFSGLMDEAVIYNRAFK